MDSRAPRLDSANSRVPRGLMSSTADTQRRPHLPLLSAHSGTPALAGIFSVCPLDSGTSARSIRVTACRSLMPEAMRAILWG